METKICNTCKEEKPSDSYHRSKTAKDGRINKCKSCVGEYKKEYYQKNKERIIQYHRDRRAEPGFNEKYREYMKDYKARNPEKYKENKHKEYLRHKDAYIARMKKWKKENPDKVLLNTRARQARIKGVTVEKIPFNYRQILKERQNSVCAICRTNVLEGEKVEIDHWMPLELGGPHSMDNLRYTHESCNNQKWYHHPDTLRSIYPRNRDPIANYGETNDDW